MTSHDAAGSASGLPDASWLQSLRRRLRTWYARNARDLPWRKTRDPYAIWVSEIMLQQTQVATVIAYYHRFLTALPTLADLAKADEQTVLRLWEGLGYYRRARQMHQAAKILADQHGGQFPNDPEIVGRLPGIGRYTLGAVLSFAFDARMPILEANTIRLHARLLAYDGPTSSRAGQTLLWGLAEAVLPRRDVSHINQALMEVGSQVCLPRNPRCGECPLESLCAARAQGVQDVVPRPNRKPTAEYVREAAVLVRRGQEVLIGQRPEGGRWAGLWDFPRFALEAEQPDAVVEELAAKVREATGLAVSIGAKCHTLRHGVTRFRITLDCYEAVPAKVGGGRPQSGYRWVRVDQLEQYPLSITGRRLARLL